ncbi:MAG: TonB-dependent receptor [Myxococcota bacterium]|nr:TonB-dependent receptor [Myxococcota bacterium]
MNRTGLSICVCAAFARGASADETIVIEGRAPDEGDRDRDRALGDAPFVTILHPDEHAATASVADALATSAGVQTKSLGGLGAYQAVSVRGAATGHTAVLVDGVPLARLAAVTTDLGRFAMGAFGEVELYRGAVPVELGGAGVGGAVNLVTRLGRGAHGERLHASIGVGSFNARHARVHYGDDHGSVRSSTTIAYQGAAGDYTYFSDNSTPLNKTDDAYVPRENNSYDQLDLASRAGNDRGAAGVRVAWKHNGLPGSTSQPSRDANLDTLDVIADGNFVAGPSKQLGYLLVERQRLLDPRGELGLGTQDRGYLTLSGGASTTWSHAIGAHRATAGLELRGDRFRDADNDDMRAALVGTRGNGAVSTSIDFALGDAIRVTPALRVDLARTAPTPMAEGPDAFADQPARWDTVTSPRLGVRARIVDDVAIKGSAGWYARLPTLIELFGNRGAIIGSPDLRPERGPSADLGIVWAPAKGIGRIDRILVESALFATRPRDTIALITTAGYAARAENIGATQSYGAELVASARFAKTLSISAAYTRLVSEQFAIDPNLYRKALPRTPGHFLYARADVSRRIATRHVGAWLDVTAQSSSFLDQANFQRMEGRALIGAGVRGEIAGGVAATVSAANLTNLHVDDLYGYPMPGRSFFLSLDWSY